MKLKTFAVLPAALALSLAFVPMAFAGPDGDHNKNGGGDHNKNGGGDHNKNGGGNHSKNGGGRVTHGGGNAGRDREVLCRLDNRVIYTRSLKECRDLEFQLGFRQRAYVSVKQRHGHGYAYGGGYVSGGMTVEGGGYGYYQPQPVVRYVAMPSRAARMQAAKRARKAAAAGYGYAAGGYGYASGGMVGYGNGIMVGGYGNNVMVNGNVYGGGYGYNAGGQVVVSKKRKGKKHRRVVVQQPAYVMQPGYGYVYGGTGVVKGGGY